MEDLLIKIEKRNDIPTTLYFFTPFIAIILTIIGGGIIFYTLGFNPIEAPPLLPKFILPPAVQFVPS